MQETELKTTVDVPMKSDQDFGNYTCEATNDVNTDTSTVLVQQISKWNIFPLLYINISDSVILPSAWWLQVFLSLY